MFRINSSVLDIFAVLLSSICVLHCLALPLLLAGLPLILAGLLQGEMVHTVLLLTALPVSLIALLQGCKRHQNRSLMVLAGVGLISMFVAINIEIEAIEQALTVVGALLVSAAHIANFRLLHVAQLSLSKEQA